MSEVIDQDVFLSIEDDRKGRVMATWTEQAISGASPCMVSVTAFRSNIDGEKFFVGISDTLLDGDNARTESTFYVGAREAAILAKVFADIAAKLS